MTCQVKLNFPHPPARPGEKPDFSHISIPDVDELPVPEANFSASNAGPYASGLIQVLHEKGKATGPWAQYISGFCSDETLRRGLRDMLRMRAIDKRLQIAQRQGKTSFYMQCTGEEAIGCGFARLLHRGDMNFPTYRQQSLLVGADYPLERLMGQVYSNSKDPLKGRQLPVLHSSREYGYFTVSGNLGTQFVQAVGWAMAAALMKDDCIAAGWIGDGATASNDFHGALLTASVYNPPVILNVVNNQWAISTPTGYAGGDNATYAQRALGYGIPAIRVDGNDYLAVLAASKWAIERTRSGYGPVLIEWLTYRVAAHSSSDDPSVYRPKNEAEAWPLGDPVERLKEHLILIGAWSQERHIQAESEILDEVKTVQKKVESFGTFVDPHPRSSADILKGVYAEMPEHLRRQRQQMAF